MLDRTLRLSGLIDEAVLLAEESNDRQVLAGLLTAQRSLREWSTEVAPIHVDLFAGRLVRDGHGVPLSRSEIALVIALALHDRGLPREALAAMLYSGADERSAANAIKVTVHRVRRRVGSIDVVRFADGRYMLGTSVAANLGAAELRVWRLEHDLEALDESTRERLSGIARQIDAGRPRFMLDWPWFADVEARIRQLGRSVNDLLARPGARPPEHLHSATVKDSVMDRVDDDLAFATSR